MLKHNNGIWGFAKMKGQKDLRTAKKGVNKIENQGENWYKCFKMVKWQIFVKI